jgi:hypothetical protein
VLKATVFFSYFFEVTNHKIEILVVNFLYFGVFKMKICEKNLSHFST